MNWGAEALWQQLEPLLPGLSIEIVPSCGSTNSVLLERARQGQHEAAVLVAEQQTAGRGRNGKAWHSESGTALLMSLAVVLEPRDWSGLSLAVGVAVADALEPAVADAGTPRVGLKWPNDVWLRDGGAPLPGQGRKLGGILIETLPVGDARLAVIGVGVNVKPLSGEGGGSAQSAQGARGDSSAAFTHEVFASGRACWQELRAEATPPQALTAVLPALVQALRRFEADGLAPFLPTYARRDVLRGCSVSSGVGAPCGQGMGQGAVQGMAQGVAADGSLLVQTSGGITHKLASGEVSVRVAAALAVEA